MRSFAPAAAGAGLALALGGALLHAQPSPVISGIIAAIVSPCSTADAVLARVVAVTPAAQAAFLIAAQCADLRQAALLLRTFGLARCATSLAAGVAGCVAAVMSLNH